MRNRLPVLLALGAVLGAPPALAAPPAKTPELVEKGRASFAKYCVACHGPKGEGDGPAAKALNPRPRNFVTQPLAGGAPAAFEVLAQGIKGTGMIAFKHLPEEERWALAYYLEGLAAPGAR